MAPPPMQTDPAKAQRNAVYDRNTQLSARSACFLDFLGEGMTKAA